MRVQFVVPAAVIFALGLSMVTFSRSSATLTFTGYTDNGRRAEFVLANRSMHYMCYGWPVIQVRTGNNWTNYCDPVESMICRHTAPLCERSQVTLSVALPPQNGPWRASVRCTLYPLHEPGSFQHRFDSVLKFFGLSRFKREFTIYADDPKAAGTCPSETTK